MGNVSLLRRRATLQRGRHALYLQLGSRTGGSGSVQNDPEPPYIEHMVEENSVNEMARRAPYIDDICYGITSASVWTVLYYNKEMFREAGLDPEHPPRTWDELIDYADRLTVRRADVVGGGKQHQRDGPPCSLHRRHLLRHHQRLRLDRALLQ